jgi:hypothetical protein
MSGFGADQGTWAAGVAAARSSGEPGKASPIRGQTHCEPHAQARAGEDCRRLVEHLTEGLGGARSTSHYRQLLSYRFMGFVSLFRKAGFEEIGVVGKKGDVIRLKLG